ncbi:LysR family transcriptional regulator [Methylobrevis albus]|uniref:LysR family transcriptional regulator n=1 Tax=Methylobrevis albus TaxID=2793297 RepID=A0A931MYT1_9HYPH|nr:LysR family transcriptional regulator [Methylobrevis albus]MBH0237309.1 LysR family transcriptional regulator [Methylobrevis albus]
MPVDTIDLRLLRIFGTIVEAGGFAAAQDELNLSLSTISGHIAALETRLGVKLCHRGRSGFRLTDDGRQVYEEARRLLASVEHFDGRVRGLKRALSGALTIGLTDNTISDPNAPLETVFAGFAREAPSVLLTVVTRPPHELLRDVVAGEIHLAVASFPRIALGLSYLDLYVETQRFYCGAEHPLYGVPDAEIDVETVRRHPIVGRAYWGQRDLKIFAIGGPRAVVSDMESEARLILSGAYLGYLPDHYAARFVAEARLRPIRSDLFAYPAPFQAAFLPDRERQRVVATFLGHLRRVFPAAGPEPAGAPSPRRRLAP